MIIQTTSGTGALTAQALQNSGQPSVRFQSAYAAAGLLVPGSYGHGLWLIQGRETQARIVRGALALGAALLLMVLMSVSALAQPAPSAQRPLKVVAFGDSLSAGYGLPASTAFPAQLQVALKARGISVEMTNASVSGDTAQGGLDRLDWSVPDGTDAVILELGANDSLRGFDTALTKAALDSIITRLKARGIAVLLCGMRAPPNLGPEYVARFDALYRDLAAKHGLMLYPFFLDGVAGERSLNLPDGIHPTAEGVKIIVSRILPVTEAFLASIKPKS
jgi:acyl-CoA thioesterase I